MLAFLCRRTFTASALLPFAPNSVWDNEGARRRSLRRGRGHGTGLGKTCGKGHKGQNVRNGGGVPPRFEGGQSPIVKRLPKFGFNDTAFQKPLDQVNIGDLKYYIERGRIDPQKPITLRVLFEAGVLSNIKYGVKLLARGSNRVKVPLHFEVSDATAGAIAAVKAAGGSVTCVYKSPVQIQYELKPHKFDLPQGETATPPPYTALKLEELKKKGAEVKYSPVNWIANYKPIEVPEITPHVKKPKPVVVRRLNFSV